MLPKKAARMIPGQNIHHNDIEKLAVYKTGFSKATGFFKTAFVVTAGRPPVEFIMDERNAVKI